MRTSQASVVQRRGESISGVTGTCTISGTLALNPTRTTYGGTFDGSITCVIPELEEVGLGEMTESIDHGPVNGFQVDGDNISWYEYNCDLSGGVQSDDRARGDIACTTNSLGSRVTIEGARQMSR